MYTAGHGLKARTVSEARNSARIQIDGRGGNSGTGPTEKAVKIWDASFQKKILDLAKRFAESAQAHSEWHRRMTVHNLNQAGKKHNTGKGPVFQIGDLVYFYKPPSQEQTIVHDRKAKHLQHYYGPASLTRLTGSSMWHMLYQGKPFQRAASMLIPQKHMPADFEFDPEAGVQVRQPAHHMMNDLPKEGEFLICRSEPNEAQWYLCEVARVNLDVVRLDILTTPTPALDNHAKATSHAKAERLELANFRRTWYIRTGVHANKATLTKPTQAREEEGRYWMDIDNGDLDKLLILRDLKVTPEGKLTLASRKLAADLVIPHSVMDYPLPKDKELTQLSDLVNRPTLLVQTAGDASSTANACPYNTFTQTLDVEFWHQCSEGKD